MRQETITKTVNIYQFDELNDEAKETARQSITKCIIEDRFCFFSEDLQEIASENYDLNAARFYYSLSNCQGDGLMFECDDILDSSYIYDRVCAKLTTEETKRAAELIKDGRYKFYTRNSKNHYYYAHKNDVDYDVFGLEFDSDYDLAEKIQSIIADIYMSICKEIERIGYNCYDVSEEDIIDYIMLNEFEFTADGNIY